MAVVNRISGDLVLDGSLYLKDSVFNQKGTPVLQAADSHQNRVPAFRQVGTAAAATCWIYTVRGAQATIKAVKAGLLTACIGDATVTVDVKKNGTTILSAAIELSSAEAAREEKAGTLSVTSAVATDVFEVVVTVDAGTGTLGVNLWVWMDINDNYAAS